MKKNKKDIDIEFIKNWMKKGFDPLVLSIMSRRNLTNIKDIKNIFFPSFIDIISPFQFKEIIKAYKRISTAIDKKEKIIIYGDKDVDGATSVAILFDYLKKYTPNIEWDVPAGIDCYGLSKDKIVNWKDKNYNLCITVDCGITNNDEIELLNNMGVETIIIDHHQPVNTLPDAIAIIDPICEDSIEDDKIAACAVVFIFILGFILYKSDFFDKNIAVLYFNDSKIKCDIYRNLIFQKTEIMNNINDFSKNKFDINYLFSEKKQFSNEMNNFIKENGINILETKIIDNKINNLYSSISDKIKSVLYETIFEELKTIESIKCEYLPLVALGTLADIMPLVNMNRILVSEGLKYIRKKTIKNITDLINRVEIDIDTISSKDLSWGICPLLNAPGRMGDATVTVLFLLDKNDSNFYLDSIFDFNRERKTKEEDAVVFFKKCYENDKKQYSDFAFFYSDKIHKGITGLAAAKLSSHIKAPTIVAAKEGDYYVGSIRGKASFHFVDFLNKAKEIFTDFGGHEAAAGFRFHQDNLDDFISFLEKSKIDMNSIEEKEEIEIDAEIPINYLNYELFGKINILEPFGHNNESPLLWTKNIEVSDYNIIGKEKNHIKFYFKTEPNPIVGIFWNKALWFKDIHKEKNRYDILYQIEINKFNKQVIPQIMITDMQISEDGEKS